MPAFGHFKHLEIIKEAENILKCNIEWYWALHHRQKGLGWAGRAVKETVSNPLS